MTVRILRGHVLDRLAELPAEAAHCVVTSPPYWGLRDYGVEPIAWGGDDDCDHQWSETIAVNATNHTDKRRWQHTRNGRDEEQPTENRVAWLRTAVPQGQFCERCGAWAGRLGLEPDYRLYVEHLVIVFDQIRRVLRPDGVVWLNLGDSYCSTAPGTRGDAIHQRGLFVGVSDRRAEASRKWRPETPIGLKPKDLIGIPWRVAFALRDAGWWLRRDIIWSKPNPMPESVEDRCTKAHEYLFLLSKSKRYWYDAEAIKEPSEFPCGPNAPGAIKSPYGQGFTRRANTHGRGTKRDTPREHVGIGHENWHASMTRDDEIVASGKRNRRSVWTIPTAPFPEAHFATFPTALVEPCILAGCPKRGLVLDPFLGAGTTALVADRLGRDCIGVELNSGYAEMAERRLRDDAGMFAQVATE
jgi:DNA modification methylase